MQQKSEYCRWLNHSSINSIRTVITLSLCSVYLFWGNWGLSNTCQVDPYSGSSLGSFHLTIREACLGRSQWACSVSKAWQICLQLDIQQRNFKTQGRARGLATSQIYYLINQIQVWKLSLVLYTWFSLEPLYLPVLCLTVSSQEHLFPCSISGRCSLGALFLVLLMGAWFRASPPAGWGPRPGLAQPVAVTPRQHSSPVDHPPRGCFSGTACFFPRP